MFILYINYFIKDIMSKAIPYTDAREGGDHPTTAITELDNSQDDIIHEAYHEINQTTDSERKDKNFNEIELKTMESHEFNADHQNDN